MEAIVVVAVAFSGYKALIVVEFNVYAENCAMYWGGFLVASPVVTIRVL